MNKPGFQPVAPSEPHAAKLRLVLVISSLGTGGAERVISIMANDWAAKGWDVHILTLDQKNKKPYYPLDERIELHPLDLLRPSVNVREGLINNFSRLLVLRRAIINARPDAVISFMEKTNILTLAATRTTRIPVIVSERVHPATLPRQTIWAVLRCVLYPFAYALVAQTQRALSWHWQNIRRKGCVIPNPVMRVPRSSLQNSRVVVAVGRLDLQKGFDLLLRAFAKTAPRYPDWSLVIWGEGPERPALENLIVELKLKGRASLPGVSSQPGSWANNASLFVLSSRFEGFPNALLEAMSAGLPVIATNCLAGPAELIEDEKNGLLIPVDDIAALSSALERLLDDTALRARLAQQASITAENYTPERIMILWDRLVLSAVKNRSGSFVNPDGI